MCDKLWDCTSPSLGLLTIDILTHSPHCKHSVNSFDSPAKAFRTFSKQCKHKKSDGSCDSEIEIDDDAVLLTLSLPVAEIAHYNIGIISGELPSKGRYTFCNLILMLSIRSQ